MQLKITLYKGNKYQELYKNKNYIFKIEIKFKIKNNSFFLKIDVDYNFYNTHNCNL